MSARPVPQVIEAKTPYFKHATPCVTKEIKLLGGEGYHELLHVQLVQKYSISDAVAKHLVNTYGAWCAATELPLPRNSLVTAM